MHNDENIDYSKPVAYDVNGRPLYAHPPVQHQTPPKRHDVAMKHAVHIAQAVPEDVVKKETDQNETERLHKESVKRHPTLHLSKNEYIISEVYRHPVGMYLPIGISGALIGVIIFGLMNYNSIVPTGDPSFESILLPAFAFIGLICLGAYITVWVYLNNKFFLTNESVIQEIQQSLFLKNEQTVGLANIEDVSYVQGGFFPTLLNYGTIRMTTEGEQTNYSFQYAANPKKQAVTIQDAIEDFKHHKQPDDN